MGVFDPQAVLDTTHDKLAERHVAVVERVTGEMNKAMEAARTYAQHLVSGGDPRDYPDERYDRHATPLIQHTLGVVLVYNAWNKARGSTNPVVPVQNIKAWQVTEYLHTHIGEPVTYATLADEYRIAYESGGMSKKGSPDEIANAVIAAQTDALIARKTKLDGKVAYVLREKREGEEAAKNSWSFPVEGETVAAGV
jgi:hypothetical protein